MTPEQLRDRAPVSGTPGALHGPAWHENEPAASATSARTTATYDEIAQRYYDHTHDRSAIKEHLVRFIHMMRAYGLGSLSIVDVGGGPGFDANFFLRAGLYALVADLSLAMMAVGRPHFDVDCVQADMRHLPFAPGIGGLWVNASLLHLTRQETPAVLSRFASILVPGGLLYLSLKLGQGAEWTAESHGLPLTRYFVYWQPDEIDALLEAAGFQIVDGWLSPVSETTTWLFRFARTASSRQLLPVKLG